MSAVNLKQVSLRPCSCHTPAVRYGRCSSMTVRSAAAVEAPPIAAAGRVKLGSSDLEVSGSHACCTYLISLLVSQTQHHGIFGSIAECCLGSMTWGQQNTEQEAHHQLSYAFDLGVNFLDTAEMCGCSARLRLRFKPPRPAQCGMAVSLMLF